MKTIAFFNNKGGVGKTSLVYHLAWMFGELGHRVIAADLDPQANLSGMFLGQGRLAEIWHDGEKKTIDGDIAPLFEGTGDISNQPSIEEIEDRIGLLVGDLALSKREDDISQQWSKCSEPDPRAFRVTTAFARLIRCAGDEFGADLALVDIGPNLGAINRAALVASDYVIIPLAPDLFSLQGLNNVGPTLKRWRGAWKDRVLEHSADLDISLPGGEMKSLGYIVMRHSIRLDRPVQAFRGWIDKIPSEYRRSFLAVVQDRSPDPVTLENDQYCLADLKDYRSLMPLAQESNKPMFMLKPADGVVGAQQRAVHSCYKDFRALAQKISEIVGIPAPA